MPQEDVLQSLLGRRAKDQIQGLCGEANVRQACQDEGSGERCIDAAVQAADICEALDVCEEALQQYSTFSALYTPNKSSCEYCIDTAVQATSLY